MRTILAVLILVGAAWRIGADWRATIGNGYAFRTESIGSLFTDKRHLVRKQSCKNRLRF